MADLRLSTGKSRYIDYSISNKTFLGCMTRNGRDGRYIDMAELKKKVTTVITKLKGLTVEERQQWVEIYQMKIKELYSMFPLKGNPIPLTKEEKLDEYGNALREALHTLVGVAKQLQLDYNSQKIAEVIQGFYFREYREAILAEMEESGYKVNDFKVLHYQQSSYFNFCCCFDNTARSQ